MAKKPVCSLLEHLTLAAASVRCTAIDGQMVAPLCCNMKLRTIVSYSPFIFFRVRWFYVVILQNQNTEYQCIAVA
jgi:hypothetical protein